MDLWEKYAEEVRQFEPTRRWEESVLIFGLIQAVRMKNQLFNHNLAASRAPRPGAPELEMLDLTAPQGPAGGAQRAPDQNAADRAERPAAAPGRGSVRQGKPKAGKLIPLRPGQD